MKNKIIRTFTVTLAAVLCLTAFSTTAFAGGTDPNPEPLPETTEAPQEEEPTTGGMEPEGVPVTPEGKAAPAPGAEAGKAVHPGAAQSRQGGTAEETAAAGKVKGIGGVTP